MPSDPPPPSPVPERAPVASPHGSSRRLVRGSSLMLVGRFCSVLINFVVQVLIVRALTKGEFGLFAYGLSIMGLGASLAVMGLGKTLERFVPIYQERGEYRKMAEATMVILGTVFGVGVLLAVGITLWQFFQPQGTSENAVAVGLIVMIGILIPFEATNHIMEKMFAVFARPRALFARRYLVGPALKILAVSSVVLMQTGVRSLAAAYVIAAMVETIYSIVVLVKVLQKDDLLRYFRPGRLTVSVRELFSFSAPMALSDLMPAIRSALVTLVLEFTHGVVAVAAFRAVLPVARLNQVALESFRLLFTPTIARLYARGDRAGIEHAYWLSSAWIAVVTFPLFVVCCVAPDYIATWLFGQDYRSSAPLLAMLAAGFYISAALGFSRQVLPTFGHVGVIFWNDLATALLSIVLTIVAVPRWGALGGAFASAAGLVLAAIINQWALFRLQLVRRMDRKSCELFIVIVAATAVPFAVRWTLEPGLIVVFAMLVVASLLVAVMSYTLLDIRDTFPEIEKLLRLFYKLSPRGTTLQDRDHPVATPEVSTHTSD